MVSLMLAALLGIVAWAQARKANKLVVRVAEAQGAFAKPTIEIKLFREEIVHLIIAAPLKKGRVLSFLLPFSIRNASDEKSARNLEAFIKMPRALLGDQTVIESTMKKVSGAVVHETEYLQTLCVSFETLHAQQDCLMPIMATLAFETFAPLSISDLVSKDGVRFSMGLRFAFELVIDFWVTQLDQKATAKSFGISVVDTSKTSVEDFLRDHNRRLAA